MERGNGTIMKFNDVDYNYKNYSKEEVTIQ